MTEYLNTRASFDTTPEEMMVEIFGYLQLTDLLACSEVSKRWRMVVENLSLWRNLCLQKGYTEDDFELVRNETKLETWREMFLCDRNWRTEKYSKRIMDFESSEDEKCVKAELVGTTVFMETSTRVLVYDINGKLKSELVLPDQFLVGVSSNIYSEDYVVLNDFSGLLYIYKKTGDFDYVFKCALLLQNSADECCTTDFCIYNSLKEVKGGKPNRCPGIRLTIMFDKLMIAYNNETFVYCLTNNKSYNLPLDSEIDIEFDWPLCYSFSSGIITVYNIPDNSFIEVLDTVYSCRSAKLTIDNCLAFAALSDVAVHLCIWDKANWDLVYSLKDLIEEYFGFGCSPGTTGVQLFIKNDLVVVRFDRLVTIINYVKMQELTRFMLNPDKVFMCRMDNISLNSMFFIYTVNGSKVHIYDVRSGGTRKLNSNSNELILACNFQFVIQKSYDSSTKNPIEILNFGA